jgi:hypothetical protein
MKIEDLLEEPVVKIENNCLDCRQSFEISSGEKLFYESKNLVLPKRCKPCRKERKLQRLTSGYAQSSINSNY